MRDLNQALRILGYSSNSLEFVGRNFHNKQETYAKRVLQVRLIPTKRTRKLVDTEDLTQKSKQMLNVGCFCFQVLNKNRDHGYAALAAVTFKCTATGEPLLVWYGPRLLRRRFLGVNPEKRASCKEELTAVLSGAYHCASAHSCGANLHKRAVRVIQRRRREEQLRMRPAPRPVCSARAVNRR